MLSSRLGRGVAAAIAVTTIAVLIAMAALWPSPTARKPSAIPTVPTQQAVVVDVTRGGCERYAGPRCRVVAFELRSGPRAGERSSLTLSDDPFAPTLRPRDEIRVARNAPGDVTPAEAARLPIDDPAAQPFAFVDFERRAPLAYLALGFVALVVALGRWQGVRSLLGLAISLAVVLAFIVPAILAGRPPLLVAVVGAMAVMLATMLVTHGFGLKTAAAILGTTAALCLTALLAAAAVQIAAISGLASEESRLLSAGATNALSLRGLVIAGIVIGALGVLDDVTVSQASTVLALKRANPFLGFGALYASGLQVGRDHLGATINTLVLAYVGAALPILLIFGTEATSFAEAVNRESVAAEIVATLVGSVGLVAAMPLTTALAALLATRLPSDALADPHGHVHAH